VDDKEGGDQRAPDGTEVGLKEGDGGRHLITYHPMGGHSSSEWLHDEPWLDFNMLRSGHSAKGLGRGPEDGQAPRFQALDVVPRRPRIDLRQVGLAVLAHPAVDEIELHVDAELLRAAGDRARPAPEVHEPLVEVHAAVGGGEVADVVGIVLARDRERAQPAMV